MERGDLDGAEAAAQYFLQLYPYAYNTGDLTEWEAMSHPECAFCASVIDRVTALHAEGGYETGGEMVVEEVTASEPVPGNDFFGVDLVVDQRPGTKHTPDGQTVEEFGGLHVAVMVALRFDGENWAIREVSIEETA